MSFCHHVWQKDIVGSPFVLMSLPFLPSSLFSPLCFPFRKPGYFLCKVRLPSVGLAKDRLRLLLENLPLQRVGERIFHILLGKTGRQSRRQKNNQPPVQDISKGKVKQL